MESNNKTKITIIVPCYNNEAYVKKCLESIKNQLFQNYEVIIINDGSKDNSQSIIEEFIKGDQRFKLFNQENKGVSTARNNGLNEATGEYVCFVDADDYIENNYLSRLLESIEESNSDLCICSVIHEKLDGSTIYIDQLESKTISSRETANQKKLIWGYACNKLYKLSIIKHNQIFFNPSIKFAEDELFYLTYLFSVEKVCFIADPLYHYVRQSQSATKNKRNLDVQANRFDSRNIIIKLLKKNNVDSYVIKKHIESCIDTCLLLFAYKYKGSQLSKEQKKKYLNYIKENKKVYLSDKEINWKAKFFLRLACFSLIIYKPIRRIHLKLTHRW